MPNEAILRKRCV
uniref:Uncharacterized protein n=1 Tax=Anguilla anguilla TaxID=7936 RepID=A0A0E9Q9R2_ANGAN